MENYYACLICIAKGDWNYDFVVCMRCRLTHTIKHQHCMKEFQIEKLPNKCYMCNINIKK